jgi:hypothetical protein
MVFDASCTVLVDAAIALSQQQLTEVMIPLAGGAVALHGQTRVQQPDAFHVHTLTLDAQAGVISDVDAPLPSLIRHGFDSDGRMAYSDVEHATTNIGQLAPSGAP